MTGTPPDDDPSRALEDALAGALDALETGGESALEEYLAARPAQAPRLRAALADLHRIDLLSAPTGSLPNQLGDFRLGEQLGAGGMGIVYAAEQVSLGRRVALKVVRPELLFFDGARERFRREIDAVARLEHPAIVPILATGNADGIPYYAMPLLPGRSAEAVVRTLARREPDDLRGSDLREALGDAPGIGTSDPDGTFLGTFWQAAVRLVRKAALGIQHAHARGVLHRDLKPSNIMLTADGRAIVLDFGLALARGDARLTRTGGQAGSPAYMAPEQVRGEPADERTDVYGLAATLHCLIDLQPPFALADPEQLRGLILAGRRREPRATVPRELQLVLDTAMDVDRLRRHATAQAFADDLQAVLDGRPIAARRLPVGVRLRRFAQRHRALSTAAVALLVFAVVLPTALLWQQQRANVELAQQVERSDRSVDVSLDAVQKLLAGVARDRLRYVPAAQEVAADMLRGAIDLFLELAADAQKADRVLALRHQALMRLAEVESARGRSDAALLAARQASELLGDSELPPELRLQRAISRRLLTGLQLDRGIVDGAEAATRANLAELMALASIPEFRRRAEDQLTNVHHHLAMLAGQRGDRAEQERCLGDAVAIASQGNDQLAHASALLHQAEFLKQGQRYDEALQRVERAHEIASRPETPERGWPVPRTVAALAQHERARIFELTGRLDEAIEANQATLASFDQLLRDYPEEPHLRRVRGVTAHNLANIATGRKDYAAARRFAEAAVRDQLEVLHGNPGDALSQQCLTEHRRTLCNALRHLRDYAALEVEARNLARSKGGPELLSGAARNLLRCAEAAEPAKASGLRAEALDLLVAAARRGATITADNDLYDPLRTDPRFREVEAAAPARRPGK